MTKKIVRPVQSKDIAIGERIKVKNLSKPIKDFLEETEKEQKILDIGLKIDIISGRNISGNISKILNNSFFFNFLFIKYSIPSINIAICVKYPIVLSKSNTNTNPLFLTHLTIINYSYIFYFSK